MAVALAPLVKYGFGNPPSGSKLWTYAAGTTTPLASYTDSGGLTANTNPIIFDSRGEANLWLLVGIGYKLAHLSATDVPIWSVDNIIVSSGGGAAGPQGPAGPAGPAGPQGPPGVGGLPTGVSIDVLTGSFAASAYAGQAEIPIAGFFTANRRVMNVELTVTQQFGASNGLASMRLGDSVTQDRFGSGITLTTGIKPQRDGDAPMFTTATTLSLFADGGLFDATGTATVRAIVLSFT